MTVKISHLARSYYELEKHFICDQADEYCGCARKPVELTMDRPARMINGLQLSDQGSLKLQDSLPNPMRARRGMRRKIYC